MPAKTVKIELGKALELLGVTADAGDDEIRAAYLARVRLHPPDRDPEMFEQIRDAYDQLRNSDARAQMVLGGPDPLAPLAGLVQDVRESRCFVGSQIWMNALKEHRP